ncbi:MAG: hypothetical protein GY812_13620 [Actinomycetia bacterium]|nr:hypothetical protein [Actinomycetes bacterium]
MRTTKLAFLIAAFLLLVGACSNDDSDSTSTTAGDSTEDSGSDSGDSASEDAQDNESQDRDAAGGAADAVMIESTTVKAPVDQLYPGTDAITSGEVTANWYQLGGNYVVVYSGLDLDSIGPACPGNSIRLADGSFSSVSNAPTADGGCEGATTPEPPAPPTVCDGIVVYTTAISSSDEGTLYGSFEIPAADGSFTGGTSTVAADASAAPEIDTSGASYEFEGTVYTC